jgi:Arabinose efflux permease
MKSKQLKVTILSFFLFSVAYGAAVTPALGDISKAFPAASQSIIGMLVTLPSLSTMIFALICGRLATTLNKRKLLIFGMTLLLIGGVGGAFYENLTFILVTRFILGIGFGFVSPVATGFIVDFFEGREQETVMGLSTAISSVGSIIFMLLAGILCSVNWRYTFLVYLFVIIPLLLAVFTLPEPPQAVHEEAATGPLLNKQVVWFSILTGCLMMFIFAYFANISIFITNEKFGNSASAGIVTSINQFASLISAASFSLIHRAFKRFTNAISIGTMGISFLILSLAPNLNMVILGSVVFGIAFGTIPPNWLTITSRLAPPGRHVFAFSFQGMFMYFGQFASSFFLPFIGSLLGNSTIRFAYLLSSIILVIVCLLMAVSALRAQRTSLETAA